MGGCAHPVACRVPTTAMGTSYPKLTHAHQELVRAWVPFSGSLTSSTYRAACNSFLAEEHMEGGNAVLEKKVTVIPG